MKETDFPVRCSRGAAAYVDVSSPDVTLWLVFSVEFCVFILRLAVLISLVRSSDEFDVSCVPGSYLEPGATWSNLAYYFNLLGSNTPSELG